MEKGEGDLDTETQRRHRKEGHMKTQAEIGVMQLKSKGTPRIARSHQKLGRGKEGVFPRTLRGSMALPTT